MNRRFTHTFASPRLTGGDERPTPACAGNPEPFDVLMDNISGPEHKAAVREARNLCAACPLMATCLRDNREEQWARAILGLDLHQPTQIRPVCGTAQGLRLHSANHERACDACEAVRKPRYIHRREEAECGTDGGYYRHRRKLKEDPCDECRQAHAVAQAARKRRLRGAA